MCRLDHDTIVLGDDKIPEYIAVAARNGYSIEIAVSAVRAQLGRTEFAELPSRSSDGIE